DKAVADPTCKHRRLLPGGRDVDWRRLFRQRVYSRVFDCVVLTVVTLHAALPELADDFDRLLEHLLSYCGLRPAIAEDVLVERLAAANSEREPARHHRSHSSGGLGDDRRVGANRRAGHAGSELEPVGGLGDPAEYGPDERRMPLAIGPWVEVVGDEGKGEAGVLGHLRVADQ